MKGLQEVAFDIIAERYLTLSSNAAERSVRIKIGRPYEESDGAHFCPYQIIGIGSETIRRAGGVDAIQALQLALVMIGADLAGYSQFLKWNESVYLGFPKSTHDPVLGGSEE